MLQQVITALALTLAPAGAALAQVDRSSAQSLAEALGPDIRPGDLVFKGSGTALWTELAARWSKDDKRWGHVGVVTVSSGCCGGAVVVHADTGTGDPAHEAAPGEEIGAVRAVPLETFLSDVDQVGLFHLALTDEERARMIAYAEAAAAARTPFDRGYSIDSENNLYCTELIWRALSAGLQRDAVPDKSRSMGRVYIALSDLSLHPLAEEALVIGTGQ